jgi:putative lipoic acid-binding regulatory protein
LPTYSRLFVQNYKGTTKIVPRAIFNPNLKKNDIIVIRLLSLQINFIHMSEGKVIYPQNFDIKLIIAAEIATEEAKRNISKALSESRTVHSFVNVRSSGKGNYLSYCYNIDIESKEHLERTYALLRTIPGLKFAL